MIPYEPYDPATVERRRQADWRSSRAFATPPAMPGRRDSFVYACTPFTTGSAHMGHVRSYTIADVCARRARKQGDAVLWAMGFDAFGLPNEIAAIQNGQSPRSWVARCRERMTGQFERLGLSVDPDRCFVTSEPDYYRWTQWVFLRLLERGLIYRADGIESWCDACQCVLAALQIDENGRCWRCQRPARLTCIPQWYMRLMPYAQELERGLDALTGWDEAVLACQRSLFGRSDGAELEIELRPGRPVTAFVADPDALDRAAFVALSPNCPELEILVERGALDFDKQRRRSLKRNERNAHKIDVVILDDVVRVPGLGRDLPVIVTPAVDMRFGGGAAIGIPASDPVDAALAEQLGLAMPEPGDAAAGTGLRPAFRYRLRDNSISRQRSWGTPIPIVHCDECGIVPVPDQDLPVRLPDDLVLKGGRSALAAHPTFSACACPRCARPARRETDTLDVHMDSVWMLVPFCVPTPERDEQMFTHPDLERWLPVSQVVCGADQAGWWMNDRLCFKVMRDHGYLRHLRDGEPVANLLMHEMVLADGRKMSKSIGNTVDPEHLISRWGADVVRLAVLKVNPRKAFNWTDEALEENHRFLSDLWAFVHVVRQAPAPGAPGGSPTPPKVARWRGTAERKIARAYERRDFHLVQKELKFFFALIGRFAEDRRRDGRLVESDRAAVVDALQLLLESLEPLAPHVAIELQERLASATEHPAIPAGTQPFAAAVAG